MLDSNNNIKSTIVTNSSSATKYMMRSGLLDKSPGTATRYKQSDLTYKASSYTAPSYTKSSYTR